MSEYIIEFDDERYEIEPIEHNGEIVRCIDCQYYEPDGEPSAVYPDRRWCDLLANYLQADGFCKWGERNGES